MSVYTAMLGLVLTFVLIMAIPFIEEGVKEYKRRKAKQDSLQ